MCLHFPEVTKLTNIHQILTSTFRPSLLNMMTYVINTIAIKLLFEGDFIILFHFQGKSGQLSPSCNVEDPRLPSDVIPTVSISIPLQTLPNSEEVQEAVPEHESG